MNWNFNVMKLNSVKDFFRAIVKFNIMLQEYCSYFTFLLPVYVS